jgi:isopentenyl-diphosphate delta-isomerase
LDRAVEDAVVSSESEELILVNSNDDEIGHNSKAACHDGDGILHRAFSLFIFNERGELLLQQRSREKRLWPGYWANSCCSHPRRGETMGEATQRRLHQELGFKTPLEFLYKFEYHARFGELGSEHELCWVYIGAAEASAVNANGNEIEATRFIAPVQLDREIAQSPEEFSPWLKLEWARLRGEFDDCLPG